MLRRKAGDIGRRDAPAFLKRFARSMASRPAESPRSEGPRQGVIEDLCFWMADARVDTVLPLQNYFSALFPELATATRGTLHLYDADGRRLGRHDFTLPAHGLVKLRVGERLRAAGVPDGAGYGTLWCDLAVPPAVLAALDPAESFYFWDRFYIAYQPRGGTPCFVHGIDKTYVVDAPAGTSDNFYPAGKRHAWAPEIPVDLTLYERFSVVVVNRTTAPARLTLTVKDAADATRAWVRDVPGRGAHRFTLTSAEVAGLDPRELRLYLDGIPTRWGRPVVVKEFANGAISAMHC